MKLVVVVIGCLVILIVGCSPKLAEQRDFNLEVGEIVAISIDPVSCEQTIKVTVTSPDSPINVHVYLQENEEEIERMITLGNPPANLLANENDAHEVSLSATVPANSEAIVRVQAAGRETANVHLEIVN